MLRQWNAGTVLTGVWLAVILLAVAASMLYTNLVTAQESSTEATLSAPALTAEAGEDAVELRWQAVTGAVRYELLVWTSADGFQEIGGDNLTGTTYSHTGLAAGTTYHYAGRALNGSGEASEWSEYASATIAAAQSSTPTATAPPVPTATVLPASTATATLAATLTPTMTVSVLSMPVLTAEAGEGAVELRWEAVTGAVRYELLVWTSADGFQEIGGDNLTGTTSSHTGLAADTTYHYAGRALNGSGEASEWSEYASATIAAAQSSTPTATAPTVPTATAPPASTATATLAAILTPTMTVSVLSTPVLTAESGEGEGTVELRWEAVTGAVRYELLAWTSGADDWQDIGGDNLTGTTFSHTGLAADTTYYYTVRALNGSGEASEWSEVMSATVAATQSAIATSTPTATATLAAILTPTLTVSVLSTPVLTAEAVEGTVELRWEAVTGAVRYELLAWTSADGFQEIGGDNLTGTSYTHSGFAADTTYIYSVRAVNGSGETSEWSEPKSATDAATKSAGATAKSVGGRAIGAVRLVSSQPGELEVSWDAPAETPRDYRISWARVGESFLTWTDLSGNAFPTSSSYTITGSGGRRALQGEGARPLQRLFRPLDRIGRGCRRVGCGHADSHGSPYGHLNRHTYGDNYIGTSGYAHAYGDNYTNTYSHAYAYSHAYGLHQQPSLH